MTMFAQGYSGILKKEKLNLLHKKYADLSK